MLHSNSPWSVLHHPSPDLSQLKVVCCACYPFLRSYIAHKLDQRTTECVFLGYSTCSKGYLCLDPSTNKLYTSRHVVFNESKFPFLYLSAFPSSVPTFANSNQSWFSNLLYLHSTNQPSLLGPAPTTTVSSTSLTYPSPKSNSSSVISMSTLAPPSQSHSLPDSALIHPPQSTPILPTTPSSNVQSISTLNTHSMQTRSKSGITCYKAIIDYNATEPPNYKIASQCSNWCKAMNDKFSALQKQNTWSLVPLPPGVNLVGF